MTPVFVERAALADISAATTPGLPARCIDAIEPMINAQEVSSTTILDSSTTTVPGTTTTNPESTSSVPETTTSVPDSSTTTVPETTTTVPDSTTSTLPATATAPIECPQAVTNLVAIPGLNSVTLSWQSPANSDAASLVEYVIDVITDARIVSVPVDMTTTTITGLPNGVEARFVVFAVGPNGASPASVEVSAIPTTGVEGEVAGIIVKFVDPVVVGDEVSIDGPLGISTSVTVADEVADDIVLIELDEAVSVAEAERIADDFERLVDVEWAEPDQFLFTATNDTAQPVSVPSDAEWSTAQWNLWDTYGIGVGDGSASMTEAWANGTGEGSVVAVIDTGVTSHPDLDGQLLPGYDFVSNPDQLAAVREQGGIPVAFDGDYVDTATYGVLGRDADPSDPGDWRGVAPLRDSSWHGTQIAGVIAAQSNSSGITGVAPGAKVLPVRALSWRGGLLSDIAAAITWSSGGTVDGVPSTVTPANVINLSFAVETACPTALQSAIDGAISRGAIVIAAAGNANSNVANFAPANCDGVIAVGATGRDGLRAPYSNWGEGVDVSAPGGSTDGGVLTTSNTGATSSAQASYGNDEGTSVAAAHVAGAAALLRGANLNLSVAEVAERLTGQEYVKQFGGATCDADPLKECGAGILSLAEIATVRAESVDYAMNFNGTSQFASGGAVTIAADLTIEAWVLPTSTCPTEQFVIFQENSFGINCSSGTWRFLYKDVNSAGGWVSHNSGIAVLQSQWQHLAVRRVDSSGLTTFSFNGQDVFTTTDLDDWSTSTDQLFVGKAGSNGKLFAGRIDEVKVWSTTRTQAQIAAEMHTRPDVADTNLKIYYDFNEGPQNTSGPGTVYNRAANPAAGSNLRTDSGTTYSDVKETSTVGTDTVVTFRRSYITAVGGWAVPQGVASADVLIVGGGGGGGSSYDTPGGGGGGAGGLIYRETSESAGELSLVPGATVGVTVGAGGLGGSGSGTTKNTYTESGKNGQDSVFAGLTAVGGGGGGGRGSVGNPGGSGGGAGGRYAGTRGGDGTSGQGNAGGSISNSGDFRGGGGGGGSTSPGGEANSNSGGAAGAGRSLAIAGSSATYAAGGAGGTASSGTSDGVSGSAGTGNGGGGASVTWTSYASGGNGGSGVVIVRYATADAVVDVDDLALEFNTSTTNQYLTIRDDPNIELTGPFTLQTWLKPTSCTTRIHTYLRKELSYAFACIGGFWHYVLGNGGAWGSWISTGVPARVNSWSHVTWTRSSAADPLRLYVDGQLAYTSPSSVTIGDSSSPLYVGILWPGHTTEYFSGQIDELRLYATGLSSSQILTDMTTHGMNTTVDASFHRAYYDFNQNDDGDAARLVLNRVTGTTAAPDATATNRPLFDDVKDVTTSGSSTIVTFPRSYLTSGGGWRVPDRLTTVKVMAVAGGGGGGWNVGGGGGGGGVQANLSLSVTPGSVQKVTVGQGGWGASYPAQTANPASGGNGQASVFGSTIAAAGGQGGASSPPNTNLASGGLGGANVFTAGRSGDGGRSASDSLSAIAGGAGSFSSQPLPGGTYGGGGGGGAWSSGAGGAGGAGGGGAGGTNTVAGTAGTANTGGGGGGGAFNWTAGGSGGSGIVILNYTTTAADSCAPVTYSYDTYTVLEFQGAGTCTWTPPTGVTRIVDALLVAGGGAGGGSIGGGGGGGEVRLLPGQNVSGQQTIIVGAGGRGVTSNVAGGSGGNSSGFGVTVNGGGGGGAVGVAGVAGGSGGGGGCSTGVITPGSSTANASGFGSSGGLGNAGSGSACVTGGGGGAGATGGPADGTTQSGGHGGAGKAFSITGSNIVYGGGGGGGVNGDSGALSAGQPGSGGIGGGGAASPKGVGGVGLPGTDGLGGGGGGSSNNAGSGDGGDGVVIVRYSNVPDAPTGLAATAKQTSVDLTWSAPSYTGGNAITGYSVQYSTDSSFTSGVTTLATGSSSNAYTVSDLTANTTYYFRVAAVTDVATSSYTSGESAKPFGAVTKFAVTMTGGTTALSAAAKTAGTPFSVRITAQDIDGNTNTAFTGVVTVTSTAFVGSVTATISASGFVDGVSITPTSAGSGRTISAVSGAVTTSDASGSFTVSAGAATQLLIATIGSQTAGSAFSVTVTLADANGNAVNNTGATGTVSLTRSSGTGTLGGTTSGTIAVGSSSVTITGLTYSKAESGVVLAATGSGASSLVDGKTGTSNAFTVSAGSATQLLIATIGSQTAGSAFSVTVTLADANGNAVNNTGSVGTVSLTRSSGTGTLGGTTSGTIAVGSSSVTITGLTYSKAESGVVIAATGSGVSSLVDGKSGTSNAFAVSAGSAASYSLSLSTTTPTAGSTVTVTAQLQDANGNPVATAGRTVTWSTTASGGSFASATSTTDANGVAIVVYTVSQTAGVSGTVTATDVSNLMGTSGSFVTQVGSISAARSTLVSNAPVRTVGGSSVTLTVQAKDQYGNDLSTGGAAVLISRDSGTGTLSVTTDNGDGTYTATVSVPTTSGSGVFSASVGGAAVEGGTGATQTVTVQYTAGPATKFLITGSSSQVAGVSQNLTITAQDTYGNTAQVYAGDKSLTFTGASAAPDGTAPTVTDKNGTAVAFGTPTTVTFTSGVAAVSGSNNGALRLYKTETGTVSVSDGSISSATAGDLAVTVSPGSLTGFVVTNTSDGVIVSPTAGTSFDVKIRAIDAFDNTQTGFTGTVDLTSTSTITSGGGTTSNFAAGVLSPHSVVLTTGGGSQSITVTRTGGAESGTSNTFSILSGSPSAATSTLSVSPSSLVADGSTTATVTVTLKDAYGNAIATDAATVTMATTAGTLGAVSYAGNGSYMATLTSPTSSGSATVTGSVDGQAMTATQIVAFTAGTANRLLVVTSPVAGASGSLLSTQPVVRVVDVNGNTVTSSSAEVTVTTGSGSLSGTRTLNASSGVVTFSDLTFAGLITSSHTLTFASTGLSSVTATVTPTGAGSAATMAVNGGNGQTAIMDSAVATAPSVIVRDSAGNPVSGVSVVFTAVNGSLAAPGSPATVTTDANGVATTPTWTLGTIIGTNQLTASSVGLTGSPVTFTATGTVRSITITAGNESIIYGATLSASFTRSGALGGSDAISGVVYTYAGTGSTSYAASTIPPTGAGTYSVTPSSASFSPGSASNYDIVYVAGTVSIARAPQTITFVNPAPNGATYGDPAIPVAPTSSSGLTVTVTSSTPTYCTVSGGAVNLIRAGTCTVAASQAGNSNYLAATNVLYSFNISKATQAAVTMTSPSTAIFGQTITLAAAGGSGTGQIVFGVSAGSCTVVGTTLTLGDAGSLCQVDATKVSDANYFLATSATQTITITQAGQTLAFTSVVPTSPVSGGTYTPSASAVSNVTGSSSGVAPTFAVTGTCSITGGVVTFNASGNCVVTASASSNTNFTAAAPVSQTIVVGSINQNVTFAQPANVSFGSSSVSMSATASSNLVVGFALGAGTTNGACSVSSLGVVTILAVGTCEVVASQVGDAQYAAASDVTRAFQILPSLPTAPTLASASPGSQSITIAFTAPGFTGGVSIAGYEVVATPSPSGTSIVDRSCTSSPCTVYGLTNGVTYTVKVAAINSAGTGPYSTSTGTLTPATAAFAVTAFSAVPGDTVVDLSWTPLTNAQLGGGAFTRYEVSYRVATVVSPAAIQVATNGWTLATAALTTQSTSTYQVTGLSNGTAYDFQLVAITTANSTEIPGNTAQVVQYPSTVPSAPQTPTVLAATATDVQFSWSTPLRDGGSPLLSPFYAVTVSSTTPGANTPIACTRAQTSDMFCAATGLTNGAVYTFTVTAQNRMGSSIAATESYAAPSSDATLSNLVVDGPSAPVTLTPAFASSTTAYTASVDNGVSTVTVTPTSTMAGSTITVDGTAVPSATASAAVPLNVGANSIVVVVTASDPRFTETYTITITRAAPVFLSLPVGGGSGSPKSPSPSSRELPDPDTKETRPEVPVTIDPITSAPPADDEWDTETMRIVDPVTNDEQTMVVTTDGTWELDIRSGLVNFTPADGFYGRAEVEFVITTAKGVTYRARLSVYVAPLGATLPITGTESQTPLIWGLWFVVAGVLAGAISRRRRLV